MVRRVIWYSSPGRLQAQALANMHTLHSPAHLIKWFKLRSYAKIESLKKKLSNHSPFTIRVILFPKCKVSYLRCKCPPWSVSGWWRLDPWPPMTSPGSVSLTSWLSLLVSTCHLLQCCHVLACTRERHVATSYRRENQTATESPEPGPVLPGHQAARHRSEKIFVRIERSAERTEWALGEVCEMFVKKCLNIMASVHKYGFRIPISSEQYPSWLLNFPVTAGLDSSDSTLSRTKDSCQAQIPRCDGQECCESEKVIPGANYDRNCDTHETLGFLLRSWWMISMGADRLQNQSSRKIAFWFCRTNHRNFKNINLLFLFQSEIIYGFCFEYFHPYVAQYSDRREQS